MHAFGYNLHGLDGTPFGHPTRDPAAGNAHVVFRSLSELQRPIEPGRHVELTCSNGYLHVSDDDEATIATYYADGCSASTLIYPDFLKMILELDRRRGSLCIHGSAFSSGGGAYLLIGDRKAGKSSSLMALCANPSCDLLSDDLVKICGGGVSVGSPFICLPEHISPVPQPRFFDIPPPLPIRGVYLIRTEPGPLTIEGKSSAALLYELRRALKAGAVDASLATGVEFNTVCGPSLQAIVSALSARFQ